MELQSLFFITLPPGSHSTPFSLRKKVPYFRNWKFDKLIKISPSYPAPSCQKFLLQPGESTLDFHPCFKWMPSAVYSQEEGWKKWQTQAQRGRIFPLHLGKILNCYFWFWLICRMETNELSNPIFCKVKIGKIKSSSSKLKFSLASRERQNATSFQGFYLST